MSKLENLAFGEVVEHLLDGKRAFRRGWHGKGMFIFQNEYLKMYLSDKLREWTGMKEIMVTRHILIFADGKFTPWVTSQADVFAIDWIVID